MRAMALASVVFVMVACSAEQRQKLDAGAAVVDAGCDEVKCDLPQPDTVLAAHCPADMEYASGEWCSKVKEHCLEWMDDENAAARRCKRYAPSECIGKRIHKSFCIETYEHTADGEKLPTVYVDTYQAQATCKNMGRRLCKESEWIFACEGEDMLPYTTGLDRPVDKCNIDIKHGLGKVGHLTDHRVPNDINSACVGPFGTINQNGNVDEITIRDVSSGKYSIALHSGWWAPVRDRCRPATVAHSEIYSDGQLGFRCCADSQ